MKQNRPIEDEKRFLDSVDYRAGNGLIIFAIVVLAACIICAGVLFKEYLQLNP